MPGITQKVLGGSAPSGGFATPGGYPVQSPFLGSGPGYGGQPGGWIEGNETAGLNQPILRLADNTNTSQRNAMPIERIQQMVDDAIKINNSPAELQPYFLRNIIAESGGNPGAISVKGASGLGQIMPGTARGLNIDPTDPAQAVEGSVRYLTQLYRQFNSIPLAIAAYNAGPGRIRACGNKIPDISETIGHVSKVYGSVPEDMIAYGCGGR